jgi:6-phosphogluconolactonase
MTKYKIQVLEDKSSLALAASDLIAQIIESTLKNKTRAKISLCGRSTPKAAYSLLGKKNIDWMNGDLLSTHLSSPRNKSTFIQSIFFLPNKE